VAGLRLGTVTDDGPATALCNSPARRLRQYVPLGWLKKPSLKKGTVTLGIRIAAGIVDRPGQRP